MYTLTKEQHKLYGKLCDKYNSKYSPYYLLCSFDSFIESEVNKALKRTAKDESIKVWTHYENIKAVQIYAENDY